MLVWFVIRGWPGSGTRGFRRQHLVAVFLSLDRIGGAASCRCSAERARGSTTGCDAHWCAVHRRFVGTGVDIYETENELAIRRLPLIPQLHGAAIDSTTE